MSMAGPGAVGVGLLVLLVAVLLLMLVARAGCWFRQLAYWLLIGNQHAIAGCWHIEGAFG